MNDKLHPALAEHAMEAELQLERERHRKTWRQLEQARHWLQVAADTLDDLQPGSALEQQIRAALSQQAEPIGVAKPGQLIESAPIGLAKPGSLDVASFSEPAPAQDDDDYMPEGIAEAIMQSDVVDAPAMAASALRECLTAPAQDEREAFEKEFPRIAYAPAAYWSDEHQRYIGHGDAFENNGSAYQRRFEQWKLERHARPAQTEQPERSGLVLPRAQLERIERRLTDWLELNCCECESGHSCGRDEVTADRDAIRAALSAQGSSSDE